MSIEPEGWHMDPSPPSWDPEAKTFSFFLHKPNKESTCYASSRWMPSRMRLSRVIFPSQR